MIAVTFVIPVFLAVSAGALLIIDPFFDDAIGNWCKSNFPVTDFKSFIIFAAIYFFPLWLFFGLNWAEDKLSKLEKDNI